MHLEFVAVREGGQKEREFSVLALFCTRPQRDDLNA
jgi:hypothetical protein